MNITPNLRVDVGEIYEAIIITMDREQRPNIAPMGVIFRNERELEMNIFKTSNTYHNLKKDRDAMINFTYDLTLFYQAALEKSLISEDAFIWAGDNSIPILKEAWCTLTVRVKSIQKSQDMGKVLFKILSVQERSTFMTPLCRSHYKILETIIHLTRMEVFIKSDPQKCVELRRKIEENLKYLKDHSESPKNRDILGLIEEKMKKI